MRSIQLRLRLSCNMGEELWDQAGDDQAKYDEANAVTRVAEEKIASAQGKH